MAELTLRTKALPKLAGGLFLASMALALALALAGGAGVAQARLAHYYDPAASAAFSGFIGQTAIAVDQANGNLYVADAGNNRILRFTAAGASAPFSALGTNAITETGTGNGPSAEGFSNPAGIAIDPSGNFYVSDYNHQVVNKFGSSGAFLAAISPDLAPNTPGVTVPNTEPGSFYPGGVALSVDGAALYVDDKNNGFADKFNSSGAYAGQQIGVNMLPNGVQSVAVDNAGNLYASDGLFGRPYKFDPAGSCLLSCAPFDNDGITLGVAVDPATQNVYLAKESLVAAYDSSLAKLDEFGSTQGLSGVSNIAVNGATDTVYVSDSNHSAIKVFHKFQLPNPSTGQAGDLTDQSATINGHIELDGGGDVTECHFEYGQTPSYELGEVPCSPSPSPGSPFSMPTDVSAVLTGLQPDTTYHYRLVTSNATGIAVGFSSHGENRSFTTWRSPAIETFSAANVAATSADLSAQINPHGGDTSYHFEYGTTSAYGAVSPVPDAVIAASAKEENVTVHLSNLEIGAVYHFRIIAKNAYGTTTSGDQTFSFFTPNCPNAHVRQETSSNTLPDCRAYELVSPADAGGTALYPSGPNSGLATSPARFAYTGDFGVIPGLGEPSNVAGDLYVATRTPTGWLSHYIGLPAHQASAMAGPPNERYARYSNSAKGAPTRVQRGVLTNPDMSTFVNWNNGNGLALASASGGSIFPDGNTNALPSLAPYVWNWDGNQIDRWPTNLASVPGGNDIQRGGNDDFEDDYRGFWGDVAGSGDLKHFFFSSREVAFAPSAAPGSAYDNEIDDGTIEVISKAPDGSDLASPEFIRFPPPASSSDGSHALMSPEGRFLDRGGMPEIPGSLYMRVNRQVTYAVSRGAAVHYIGMTPNGASVYFTSSAQLTTDDHDTSADLFKWSEEGDSLTRLSIGIGGTGDTDSCAATWTTDCGVQPYTGNPAYCELEGAVGGNCISDGSIAKERGSIYFYSPERLDGHGVNDKQNLYDFRNGHPQHVATFEPESFCVGKGFNVICSDGPIVRLQVTPDDSHAAFITADRLTSYDNAGHLEMYTYEPETGKIRCVSCIPSGEPPTYDVRGSQNGSFLTNDGRAFFYTYDALVPQDTNEIGDVYEFVDGRPQLITAGTGTVDIPEKEILSSIKGQGNPGLVSVSADGTDVYFSTYDTLVGQDRNGNQLKFYDARVGGGFTFVPSPPPCVAADECHGPASAPPVLPAAGTGASLGEGGNLAEPKTSRKNRNQRRGKKRRGKKHRHLQTTGRRTHG